MLGIIRDAIAVSFNSLDCIRSTISLSDSVRLAIVSPFNSLDCILTDPMNTIVDMLSLSFQFFRLYSLSNAGDLHQQAYQPFNSLDCILRLIEAYEV